MERNQTWLFITVDAERPHFVDAGTDSWKRSSHPGFEPVTVLTQVPLKEDWFSIIAAVSAGCRQLLLPVSLTDAPMRVRNWRASRS